MKSNFYYPLLIFAIILPLNILACENEGREIVTASNAQQKLYKALVSKLELKKQKAKIKNALNKGADPNGAVLIVDKENRHHILRYAPPLAYSDDIRPEIINLLVKAGAKVQEKVFYNDMKFFLKDGSIAQFFTDRFLKSKDLNNRRVIAKTCIILETLLAHGASKKEIKEIIEKQDVSLGNIGIGVIYHMLMACKDTFSAFIDSINKFDAKGVAYFGEHISSVNNYDKFGISPLAYALFDLGWRPYPTTPLRLLEELGVDKYQSLSKHESIVPINLNRSYNIFAQNAQVVLRK